MKRLLFIIMCCAASAVTALADSRQTAGSGMDVTADGLSLVRSGRYIILKMNLGLNGLDVDRNRAVLLTPRIVGTADSVDFNSVGIYGRTRYYHYLRENGEDMLTGSGETVIRASQKPATQQYEAMIPYSSWMEGADLVLQRQDYGCCGNILDENQMPLLGDMRSVYNPDYRYLRPKAEPVKTRSLSGSAFINFPVNKTDIRPTYMDNTKELGKITATIDSVKADSDVRITSMSIKGYASPEGTYANNTRLARGRTEALRLYVSRLYHFDDGFIKTDYEPENWQGLRDYVEKSGLEHRYQILDIIDSDLAPDPRELKLKTTYPDEYRFLLMECYPRLRRSDYKVEYVVRQFSDAEEIKRIMKTQPQKLSLEEFYIAAQSMEPGSREFDEAFETAVRMYPDDETANLNAANSAMKRNDMKSAARYLDKAGSSPLAIYARAVYAGLNGDRAKAESLFNEAERAGVSGASAEAKRMGNIQIVKP